METLIKITFTIILLLICFIALRIACSKSNLFFIKINRVDKVDIFSPVVLFPFTYSVLYSIGSFNYAQNSFADVSAQAYSYYFIGIISYYCGLILINQIYRVKAKMTSQNEYEKEFALILSGFLIFLFFSIIVIAKAGIPIFQDDISNSRTQVVKIVGGWLYYMYKTLPLFTALLLILKWKYSANKSILMLTNFLLPIGFAFMILGAYRGTLITTFLLLLIVYHYAVKPISFIRATFIFFILIIAYAFIGYIRASSSYYAGGWSQVLLIELSNPAKALSIITSRIPDEFPFFKGIILLNAFMTLLPGEQLAYGLVLKDMFSMHYSGGGFTPSLLGGFYLDFGMIGIVVFMAFYGITAGFFYKKMRLVQTPYNTVIYAFILQYFIISIRGGFLQEILPVWFFLILSFLKFTTEKAQRVQPKKIDALKKA